jgi:DNA-binding NarL/FixJ family response regulator
MRILIADDHELVRKGLRTVLENQPGWKVCGEAVNGRQAVDLARQLRPDVVVLDITMPELNGLEATRQIRKALPNAEVLILTMHESEQLVSEVLAAGARGYLLKADTSRLLVSAIESLSSPLAPGQSPCLDLPDAAFADPRLLSTCPHCAQALKFNPFFVDMRQ